MSTQELPLQTPEIPTLFANLFELVASVTHFASCRTIWIIRTFTRKTRVLIRDKE